MYANAKKGLKIMLLQILCLVLQKRGMTNCHNNRKHMIHINNCSFNNNDKATTEFSTIVQVISKTKVQQLEKMVTLSL